MAVEDPAVMDINTSTVYTIQIANKGYIHCSEGEMYYEGSLIADNAEKADYQFIFTEAATDAQGRKLYYISPKGAADYFAYNENTSNAGGAANSVGLTNNATTKSDKGVWYIFDNGTCQFIVPAWKDGDSFTRGGCCWNAWSNPGTSNYLGMWGRGTSDPNYQGDNQLLIVEVKAEVEPENRTDYVHNEGSMNRSDRGLTSFTITDGTNSLEVTSIQTSNTAPVYVDKSEQKLTTYPGATLSFSSFNYKGSWMHAYAFVDYNKDYYFEPVDNNGGTTDGEVVSYNYFNGKTITGDAGDQGNAMAREYNGSKTLPAFTLPAGLEPGEYRMRIKVDWNNLDADYGASDIAANGGAQCDITLVVEEIVGNEVAKAGLASKIEAAIALFNAVTIGDGVGKYSSSIDDAVAEFLAIQEYYNSITASTPIEEIEAKTARVGEIVASFSLNMPKNGEYFRVAYDYGGTVGKLYMQGVDSEQFKNNQNSYPAKFAADNGAESIWYYYNGALYSYTAGKCIAEKGNDRGLQNIGVKVNATFSASTRAEGKYNIACTSYIHANVTGSNYYTDHCSGNNCVNHDLILEAVTELPVSISAAGKATFFAPVAVEIPTGVKAYTVTINDEWATLNEVEGDVIPANTGVVLEGAPNTYGFAITAREVTATSDLRGSAPATYYTEAGTYYALGVVDDVVAFYKDAFNNSRFQNNSHKAYLYVAEANGAASYSFRFGEGTTGIENVEVENAVKAIYDLTGRKVEAITAPGIYIVNGVKRVVR